MHSSPNGDISSTAADSDSAAASPGGDAGSDDSFIITGSTSLLPGGGFEDNAGIVIDGEAGTIIDVGPLKALTEAHPDALVHDWGDVALLPGTINVHNHSYQSLARGLADDRPFMEWRDDGIYWLSKRLDRDDIYTGALLAFGEMMKYGVTTVCDFFYIQDGGNANSRAVIQAAEDLGIRLVLARTMYDWEGAPAVYVESIDGAVARTEELIAEYRDHPTVDVCPAPHSPHAASPEMIQAGHRVAQDHGTRMHIHLAEGEYEVEMTQERWGATPLRYLDDLGVVDDDMVAVHCVNLDAGEIAMMGERGASLAYCPSSNMFLGDGITDIRRFLAEDVTVGLGTDGACSNNRISVLEEMRMTGLLQKVSHRDGAVCPAEATWSMGTDWAADLLDIGAGRLAPGRAADVIAVDLDDLSLQPRFDLQKNLVYSLQPTALRRVMVAGRTVVEDGRLQTVAEESIGDRVSALRARLS